MEATRSDAESVEREPLGDAPKRHAGGDEVQRAHMKPLGELCCGSSHAWSGWCRILAGRVPSCLNRNQHAHDDRPSPTLSSRPSPGKSIRLRH
jgi:hypothetical protein